MANFRFEEMLEAAVARHLARPNVSLENVSLDLKAFAAISIFMTFFRYFQAAHPELDAPNNAFFKDMHQLKLSLDLICPTLTKSSEFRNLQQALSADITDKSKK